MCIAHQKRKLFFLFLAARDPREKEYTYIPQLDAFDAQNAEPEQEKQEDIVVEDRN